MTEKLTLDDEQLNRLKKIGKTLKHRREELSYTLQRASDVIRIAVADLRAIEQADYEQYPQLVFLRGFIRNYCSLLEIDSQWMISDINEIYNLDAKEENNGEKASSFKPALIIIAAGGLITTSILITAAYFYLAQDPPPAVDVFAKTPQTTASQAEPAAPAVLSPDPARYHLSIDGLSRGWVRVQIDDQPAQDVAIASGDSFNWQAEQTIALTISRGDAARITLNDEVQPIAAEDYNRLLSINFAP